MIVNRPVSFGGANQPALKKEGEKETKLILSITLSCIAKAYQYIDIKDRLINIHVL